MGVRGSETEATGGVPPRDRCFTPVAVCPLCSAPLEQAQVAFTVLQIVWQMEVLECPVCGLVYKAEFPTDEMLGAIYAPTYRHFLDTMSYMQDGRPPHDRTRRLGPPRGRHLDYGCGAGEAVWEAHRAGWDSYGCDPFLPELPADHPLATRLFRWDAAGSEPPPDLGTFDSISLWAVVEHLTSPYRTFEGLARLLAPGGELVFNCPNGASLMARKAGNAWTLANLVEHVLFMTPRSSQWLAASLGLHVRAIRHCGSPYPAGKCVPGWGVQGLPSVLFGYTPAALRTADTGTGASPNAEAPRRRALMRRLRASLMRRLNSGDLVGRMARAALGTTRLGDHIEVCLARGSGKR